MGFLPQKNSLLEKQKIKCLEIWNSNISLISMQMQTKWHLGQILFTTKKVTKTVSSQLGEALSACQWNCTIPSSQKQAGWPAVSCLVFTINFFSIYQHALRFLKYYLLTAVIPLSACHLLLNSLHWRSRCYLHLNKVVLLMSVCFKFQ